jgi:hypothetical protein
MEYGSDWRLSRDATGLEPSSFALFGTNRLTNGHFHNLNRDLLLTKTAKSRTKTTGIPGEVSQLWVVNV